MIDLVKAGEKQLYHGSHYTSHNLFYLSLCEFTKIPRANLYNLEVRVGGFWTLDTVKRGVPPASSL